MEKIIVLVCLLCLVAFVNAKEDTENIKSLQEVIDAATSQEVDALYNGKSSSIYDMLVIVRKKTEIDDKYLDQVFMETADAKSVDELKLMMLDMETAVTYINMVIAHFQEKPMAGREKSEL
uniref:Uncharacterized protein n=1 Tax=Ciona savignyi TaxID=51511 RepID=H2YF41_CIOSA